MSGELLSNHYQPDPELKIQSFNLDSHNRESGSAVFDPERDISEENWEKMVKTIQTFEKSHCPTGCAEQTWSLYILKPDLLNTYMPNPEVWGKIVDSTKGYNIDSRIDISIAAQALRPDLIHRIIPERVFFELCLDHAENFLKISSEQPKPNWKKYAQTAIESKILFPEKIHGFKHIDSELSKKLFEIVDRETQYYKEQTYSPWRPYSGLKTQWSSIAHTMTIIKLLFPEHAHKLNLSAHTWQNFHEQLRIFEENIYWYTNLARNMKILAAAEIHFTNRGLKIVSTKQPTALKLPTISKIHLWKS